MSLLRNLKKRANRPLYKIWSIHILKHRLQVRKHTKKSELEGSTTTALALDVHQEMQSVKEIVQVTSVEILSDALLSPLSEEESIFDIKQEEEKAEEFEMGTKLKADLPIDILLENSVSLPTLEIENELVEKFKETSQSTPLQNMVNPYSETSITGEEAHQSELEGSTTTALALDVHQEMQSVKETAQVISVEILSDTLLSQLSEEENIFDIEQEEEQTEEFEIRTLKYYKTAALLNLLNTSRTAECGEIDVSAAGGELKISKESIGDFNPGKILELKSSNEKARNLDLNNLKNLLPDEIKEITIQNFKAAINIVFQKSKEILKTKNSLEKFDLVEFITNISKIIGKGIVDEEKWFREHDSRKFPYTNIDNLHDVFVAFCQEFLSKIRNMPEDPREKIQWAQKTSAWVEYRINLTDHFMTDSCGKVATVMSTFVCILANHPLPIFSDKKEYLSQAPTRPRDTSKSDENQDKQYKKWEDYYVTKFLKKDSVNLKLEIEPEHQEKYYKYNALDNLGIISKTSTRGVISTTGYLGKEREIQKQDSIEVRSLVVASFSTLIEYFHKKKDEPIDKEFLEELIKNIVFQLNAKHLNIKSSAPISTFFRDKDGSYPYASWAILPVAFQNFLDETVERLNDQNKYDLLETIALIHYRIFLHHHFFKDGNNRIALALVTYVCIKFGLKLPKFSDIDRRERHYVKVKVETDKISDDPQFDSWLYFYRTLFLDNPNTPPITSNIDFEDGWDITIEKILDKQFTIYEVGTRDFHEIEEMKKATGYEVKELVVFKPERMFLHELIIYIKTNLKTRIQDKEAFEDLKEIINNCFCDELVKKEVSLLAENFKSTKIVIENYIGYLIEDYFHIANANEDLQERVKKFNTHIQDRIKNGKCNIRLSDSKELMVKLISDDLLRDLFKKKVREIVEIFFEEKRDKYSFLKLKRNVQRAAWAIVGGPAAGKSSLKTEVREQIQEEDGCCVVNPDDYKPLLETEKVRTDNLKYAALVHEESSYITDEIFKRLKEMVEANKAPNILLDIVTSSEKKMSIAGYGGATIYLNIATCPVEGTEGAIDRAFTRARDNSPENDDKNRYVPTKVVLAGHKGESVLLPETIEKFKVNLRLFDTSGGKKQPPKLSAVIDTHNKQLKIYEPKSFYQFIKKSLLNEKAAFAGQAYLQNVTGEDVANLFLKYLNKGIELIFMYGQEVQNQKVVELSEKKRQIAESLSKPAEDSEVAKKRFEMLALKQKLRQLKKESTFAIFSLDRGIICNDFEALCNLFPEGDSKKEVQDFLFYFVKFPILKENGIFQNVLLYLYGTNGDCILRKDIETDFEIFYDEEALKKMCPVFFDKISPHRSLTDSMIPVLQPFVQEITTVLSDDNRVEMLFHSFKNLANNPNVISQLSPIAQPAMQLVNSIQGMISSSGLEALLNPALTSSSPTMMWQAPGRRHPSSPRRMNRSEEALEHKGENGPKCDTQ